MRSRLLAAVVLTVGAVTTVAMPAFGADAEAGEKVFKKCATCHVADKETNKIGPHLVGLFGRTAGKLKGYKYSSAMAASDVVWNAETLASFVKAPRDFIPGTKMTFAGLKDDGQIADLIAYLEEETAKSE